MVVRWITGLCIALLATGVAAVSWYRANLAMQTVQVQRVAAELLPIKALVQENQAMFSGLQAEHGGIEAPTVLQSYLDLIRSDGVAKHAEMKHRLDALAENNTAIVTLIKAYGPQAKTTAFVTESDRFRNYASAWRDRWNSVMEIFMAGGNYPVSAVPFPSAFPTAIEAEIAASR